jgi:hypothetical protein
LAGYRAKTSLSTIDFLNGLLIIPSWRGALSRRVSMLIAVGVYLSDPVSAGFAMSLARPGQNITGLTLDASPEAYAKQLELLKQIAPRVRRVQVLRNPDFYGTFNQHAYTPTVENAAGSAFGDLLLGCS